MKVFRKSHSQVCNIILCIIVFIQSMVMVYWGTQKDGIFYDELITFQRAAELFRDKEESIDWEYQNNLMNQFHTHEEFLQNLTVMEDDELQDQSLSQIIYSVIFGRLYNVLLNFISSFQNESLAIWYPIGMNILFFALAQIMLYMICLKLYREPLYGIVAVTLYGFSKAALLTVMYIRFYELYVLICLLHVYLHFHIWEAKQVNWRYVAGVVGALVLTWIGYRNAEYTIVFAAVSAFVYLFYCIKEKNKKKFWTYLMIYSAGGIIFIGKYARSWLASYNSSNNESQIKMAIEHLISRNWGLFVEQGRAYIQLLLSDSGLPKIIIILIILLVIVTFIKKRGDYGVANKKWCYIGLITVLYLLVIAKIAPWVAWRYISNLFPFFLVLCVGGFVYIKCPVTVKSVMLLAVFVIQLYRIGSSGTTLLSGGYSDGPSFSTREEVNSLFEGQDGICFWNEDRGDLYYAAFLWPDNTKIYLTTPEKFESETEDKKEILRKDEILVWVRTEEDWQDSISALIRKEGYTQGEYCYDMGSGRWRLYKCTRN